MPKEEWGVKRVCPTTGKRFYDLNRKPIISPYTGEVVDLDAAKPGRGLVASKADKKVAKEVVIEEVTGHRAEAQGLRLDGRPRPDRVPDGL